MAIEEEIQQKDEKNVEEHHDSCKNTSSEGTKGKLSKVVTTKGTESLVLKAISVWINKPQVVNRRLTGAKILFVKRCTKREEAEAEIENARSCHETFLNPTAKPIFKDLSQEEDSFVLLLRELIPKSQFFPNILEAVLYAKEAKSVTFIPLKNLKTEKEGEPAKLNTEELEYALTFKATDKEEESLPAWSQVNELCLSWSPKDRPEDVRRQVTDQWLQMTLLDKLVNWSQVNDISTSASSLQLVSVDQYKETYVRLKNTYGRDLVANWTERTDPKKFVYEDIAIAAYLLLIWEEDRKKKNLHGKQRFVDLGCGNGLLVYILTKEGHKGLGIDLRKRKIWDTFGPDIDLREQTITPSADHLFPEYDWIIGNHSDELTPWIPIIAARSSYQCNFFVLPCCHHDFVGKFNPGGKSKKGKSQYGAYLDYVEDIVARAGFYPETDTLRIPSTKRICYIGRGRSYAIEVGAKVDGDMQEFINKRIEIIKATTKKEDKMEVQPVENTEISWAEKDNSLRSCMALALGTGTFHRADSSDTDSGLGSWKSDSSSCSTSPSILTFEEGNPFTEKRKLPVSGTEYDQTAPSHQENTSSTEKKLKLDPAPVGKKVNAVTPKWASDFKPRVEQGIRNCQTVAEETKRKIVNVVFHKVLNSDDDSKAIIGDGRSWRKGGAVPLSTVVKAIDSKTLQELKAECGGLQTLLRNHSHVFQVTNGKVRLRDFSAADPWKGRRPKKGKKEKNKTKTLACWFYSHHPDGCPRDDKLCTFAHGDDDLRIK